MQPYKTQLMSEANHIGDYRQPHNGPHTYIATTPYHHRVYEYVCQISPDNKVGRQLKSFVAEDSVLYSHPQCKAAGLVLPSVTDTHFKNHTTNVHKIF